MKPFRISACLVVVAILLAACVSQTPANSPTAIPAGTLASAAAYLQRGDQYSAAQEYDLAIADYTAAIRLNPDYAEAYNNRGLAYSLKGKNNMPQAIADYSQAIRLRPDYAYAINNRGVAYMASGHPDEALQDFNLAIQLQPGFTQAHSNRGNYYVRANRLDLAIPDLMIALGIPIALAVAFLIIVFLTTFVTLRRLRRK